MRRRVVACALRGQEPRVEPRLALATGRAVTGLTTVAGDAIVEASTLACVRVRASALCVACGDGLDHRRRLRAIVDVHVQACGAHRPCVLRVR